MLILSQDKNGIVNLTNITSILVEDKELIARVTNGHKATLGEYATEERAKEVLQEIIKACTCWEDFKYGIVEGIGTPKYEMPKE